MKSMGQRATGARLERMQASPRWDGQGFRNVHPIAPGLRDTSGPRASMLEILCPDERRRPPGPLPTVNPRETWTHAPSSGLRASWLGHSSVLIEIDGLRLLTDPVWGPRVSPSTLAGPKRYQPPPVPLRALPPLDAVLISHDHYDHLDYPTLRALAKRPQPFITSLGVGAHLESWGIPPERIIELDWWESTTLTGAAGTAGTELRVHAAPSQHFSGRGLKDRYATLWSSFVIETQRHRVFFSGDTGLSSEYLAIRDRFGPFDLVMLEVGAHHPSWGDIHLGPVNALQAWEWLGGGALLPVHWGTFNLATHDWDEPAETLLQLAPGRSVPLLMPRLGEALEPSRATDSPAAWWREPALAAAAAQAAPAKPFRLPRWMPWPLD